MTVRSIVAIGFSLLVFATTCHASDKKPPQYIIDAYIQINERLKTKFFNPKDIGYGYKDVNGDGKKDWYLYPQSESNGYCKTFIFLNQANNYCYAGTEWLHMMQFKSPALHCDNNYLFSSTPAKIYTISIGPAHYNDSGALVINNSSELTFNRNSRQLLGFNFNYQTGKDHSVLKLRFIAPGKTSDYTLAGFKSTRLQMQDGRVVYDNVKELSLGKHNFNQALRFTPKDAPGSWILEFYADGKLFKKVTIKVQ